MSKKIDCLGCMQELIIPKWINKDDYKGQVRCDKCRGLLYLKYKDGKLREYKLVEMGTPFETKIQILHEDLKESKKVNHKEMLERVRELESEASDKNFLEQSLD